MANYRVVEKEIFRHETELDRIYTKFRDGHFKKIHISKLTDEHWEVKYLNTKKDNSNVRKKE